MYKILIKPFLLDLANFIKDTLFPITCLSCENVGSFVCEVCEAELKESSNQICISCHKPAIFGLTHEGCKTSFSADGLICLFNYKDPKVSQILIKGKYSFLPDTYKVLGEILAKKLKQNHDFLLKEKFSFVPIPLHKTRKRWRGFNQSEILAKTLSENLNSDYINLLKRNRITKTQKDLNREQRLKNLQDAFELDKDIKSVEIKGKSYILVDDVTTTGATLKQAAKILKRNGAKKVICLTVARD